MQDIDIILKELKDDLLNQTLQKLQSKREEEELRLVCNDFVPSSSMSKNYINGNHLIHSVISSKRKRGKTRYLII